MNLRGRARVALRWAKTSDEMRPRLLAIGALVSGFAVVVGVALAAAAPGRSISTPGPLSSPHTAANLTCASCHDAKATRTPASTDVRVRTGTEACTSCHGEHALRGGHARASAAGVGGAGGALTCATCHPAHGAETVSFRTGGKFVHTAGNSRSEGTGPEFREGTNVPVLRAERCTGCHDLSRAADPLRPCVDATGVLVRCFGEHDRSGTSPRVCAPQHDDARFAARDAAARIVGGTSSPTLAGTSSLAVWLGLGPVAAGLVAFTGARMVRRRRKPLAAPASSGGVAATSPATAASAPLGVRRLPVIDVSRCLGCYACVDACAFDVLDVERYVAKVARPDACCSATSCAEACPNGSLVMREEGVLEGGDGPLAGLRGRLSLCASFEIESAPGVFLVGDVTGVPLIKNAFLQGRTAIDAIAARTANKRARRDRSGANEHEAEADVLIVGAGPAGLAASLRAEERGLSYVTLEQSTVAASIKSFPRGKLVFDAPIELPLEGEIAVRECTKEELVAHWNRIVRTRKPRILEQHRVVSLARESSDRFVVAYERADGSQASVRARAVVLAIGQRGTPRRLDASVAPGAESMIVDALFDARSFAGQRVIVVGLGDAALEAVQALAHQPGIAITLVHRGADFTRGRAKNVAEVKSLIEANRVQLRLASTVTHVDRGRVVLSTKGVREELDADVVLALLGGVPSRALLDAITSV